MKSLMSRPCPALIKPPSAFKDENQGKEARGNEDYYVIGDEYFIRGTFDIPVIDDAPLSFGVWAKVSEEAYGIYRELYNRNPPKGMEPLKGHLDGHMFFLSGSSDEPLNIHLRSKRLRPAFSSQSSDSNLGHAQSCGISKEFADSWFQELADAGLVANKCGHIS